ncbi:MAG: CoB--CoM heterodisulfide reductase subunit C [Promethearchaeota archaeon]
MIDSEPEIIKSFTDNLANSLKNAGYPEINACIQCGTCSGGCPSGRRTALRVRTIIRKVQLGIEEVLTEKDIWYCSTCYTCLERCPRKLPITDMLIYLRNLAVRKGFILESHLELCKKLYDSGHGVPIDDDKWKRLRQSYGLKQIPPTVHSNQTDLKEIQILLHSAKFDKLVNLDSKKKEVNKEER